MMRVCPSGCVCHAVRAPGSNVTLAPATRAGAGAGNSGSMRTVPVNQSAGPLLEGCEPLRLISILFSCSVLRASDQSLANCLGLLAGRPEKGLVRDRAGLSSAVDQFLQVLRIARALKDDL